MRSASRRVAALIAAAGVVVLLARSFWPPSRLLTRPDPGDVELYFDYARLTFDGQVPYRDF